jgi:hypothetical protein
MVSGAEFPVKNALPVCIERQNLFANPHCVGYPIGVLAYPGIQMTEVLLISPCGGGIQTSLHLKIGRSALSAKNLYPGHVEGNHAGETVKEIPPDVTRPGSRINQFNQLQNRGPSNPEI